MKINPPCGSTLQYSAGRGLLCLVSLISYFIFNSFYRATRMNSEDYVIARCLSVCLSVRLSHAVIVSKRLHISSKCFNHRVASPF